MRYTKFFGPKYTPKRNKSRDSNGDLHTSVHSSPAHNKRKVKITPVSVNKGMDTPKEVCGVHASDGVSFSLKRDGILTPATIRMNVESIVLSEISRTKKSQ